MTIDVSEAIDGDTAEVVTVERTAGSYTDGIYVKGATVTFKTMASVQQPTAKQLQSLPEGERDSDVMLFIAKKTIYTASDRDGLPADTILRRNTRYKVIAKADWEIYGHNILFGARIK